MQEFELPVVINDGELLLNARLYRVGYIYRIEVDVNDMKVQFERDEEGEWRALLDEKDFNNSKTLNKEVLKSIIESIDFITK